MITGKAKIAGVIGYPIAHSLSPVLHNYWLKTYHIDGAYIPLLVEEKNIQDAVALLPKLGIKGCNVTLPHKEAVVEIMDELTESAKTIGAVNTITVTEKGRLQGDNTDWIGFIKNIKHAQPNWSFKNKEVLLLGSGGAAKAIVFGLIQEGVKTVFIAARTPERAESMALLWKEKVKIIPWEKQDEVLSHVQLVINSTPLGMIGKPPLNFDIKALSKEALVTDIVYNPLLTELLKTAQARGNPIVDGLGMLLYQAVPGFQRWFGKEPEVTEEVRRHVLSF